MVASNPQPVEDIVRYAQTRVPRYHGYRSFDDIPTISKAQLREDPAAFISDEFDACRSELARLLVDEGSSFGRCNEARFQDFIIIEQTSGSSGVPLRIPKTISERAACARAIWADRKTIDPVLKPENFYPLVHPPPGMIRVRSPGILTQENITALYEHMSERGVRWIHTNPRLIAAHMNLLDDSIIRHGPFRFLESSGFAVEPALRELVSRRWGLGIVDQYGCREVWTIGTRTDGGPFHLLSANNYVEILDRNGVRIENAGEAGRVIVTARFQKLFPIIRYDTGDIGHWLEGRVGSCLFLSSERASTTLLVGGCEFPGNSVFKELMFGVYSRTGFIGLDFLQIRQTDEKSFTVYASPHRRLRELLICIAERFNAQFPNSCCTFTLRLLTPAEILERSESKPILFLNERCGKKPAYGSNQ